MTKISQFLDNNPQYKHIDKSGMIEYKILNFLKNIDKGFFIEAGAYDGIFQSNTKILEDLGWSGLLIEPSPEKSKECYYNRNKNSIVKNCALVSFDYMGDCVMGNFGAPTSAITGVGVAVSATTLTKILCEMGITYVDFFSLDTEGYEMEVLRGVDFNIITFNYLLIEINLNSYSLEQMDCFLLEKGYINISNISNFSFESDAGWPGNHQDYLYKNKNLE